MKYDKLSLITLLSIPLLTISIHASFVRYKNIGDLTIYQETFKTTIGKSPVTIDAYTYTSNNLLKNIQEFGYGTPLYIGKFCIISDSVEIKLEYNNRSELITTYPLQDIDQENFKGSSIASITQNHGVYIGNDVWIGANVKILPGVIIGDGVIILSNSVVANSIEPYSIVIGNPAKLVHYRFNYEIRTALQQLQWWNLDTSIIGNIIEELSNKPDINIINSWINKYRKESL